MSKPSFVTQLLARDPRRLVRFPDVPLEAALLELQEMQAKLGQSAPPKTVAAEPPPTELTDAMTKSLSDLATQVWRAKGKLLDGQTGEPKEENRRVYRHIEGALETFTQMGLTLNDWIAQPYDPGLPVKVLTFQPTPGLMRDTIVETIRPTVIWKDRLLQLGEVVVGIPANTETPQ